MSFVKAAVSIIGVCRQELKINQCLLQSALLCFAYADVYCVLNARISATIMGSKDQLLIAGCPITQGCINLSGFAWSEKWRVTIRKDYSEGAIMSS